MITSTYKMLIRNKGLCFIDFFFHDQLICRLFPWLIDCLVQSSLSANFFILGEQVIYPCEFNQACSLKPQGYVVFTLTLCQFPKHGGFYCFITAFNLLLCQVSWGETALFYSFDQKWPNYSCLPNILIPQDDNLCALDKERAPFWASGAP